MQHNKVKSNLGFFGLAFALVFGLTLMTATSTVAQNRNDRRDDDRNERRDDRSDRNRNDRRNDDDDYYNNRRRNDNNDRWDNNRRWDNDRDNQRRYITQQAYRAGMSQGLQDARDGRRYNANRAAGRAMGQVRVYNSRNQGEYKRIFREAFVQGYREGYDRYGDRNDRWRNNRDRRNDY